jgi:hypothetical protein
MLITILILLAIFAGSMLLLSILNKVTNNITNNSWNLFIAAAITIVFYFLYNYYTQHSICYTVINDDCINDIYNNKKGAIDYLHRENKTGTVVTCLCENDIIYERE